MEDNINSDNDSKYEDHQKKENIKKIILNKKIIQKNSSKKRKKSNLILNTESDLTQNSLLNTNFTANKVDLSYFSKFPGFFNKKFNLTIFKKQREDSRSRSKSPERLRLPHQIRGNGIPKNINERLKFLKNIFESENFQKAYEKIPKRNNSSFEEFCFYFYIYGRKTNILNAILLLYYFVCHEIKYDYDFKERNEDFKKSQKAENVYESGLALSLGYTNIFEGVLKKLDVRFKHIEGYCKYLPKDNNSVSLNDSKKFNKNNSTIFTLFNNSSTSSVLNNSKYLNKNNDQYEPETESIYDYINHCWNAFYFKGEWYFVDTLMGSGSFEIDDIIKEQNQFKSKDPKENFNLFYILPCPNHLIYSHFPAEDDWQLTDKIWTFKQFLNKYNLDYPKFFKGISKYNVELLTHDDPLIQIMNKDKLVIKIRAFDYILEGNLYNSSNGQKISEIKNNFAQKEKIFTFEPTFSKCGDYLLRMNLRVINSTDLSYRLLFDYRIKVINNSLFNHFEKYNNKLNSPRFEKEDILPKIGRSINLANTTFFHRIVTDYKKIFPSKEIKKVCYDNEGFYLLEPRTIYLRKGVMTKFKIRIKGATHATLLDGTKWTNLKRVEDGVYEGQKIIETDNVSICCLRGKNVFTEVFKFKPRRNKYDLSHSQAVNHTMFKRF